MRWVRGWVFLFFALAIFVATIPSWSPALFAATLDRISGPIDSSQMVSLHGNVPGQAQGQFDQGRAGSSQVLRGVSIVFKPSVEQQAELDQLLADQQNPSSANYHKWLTPAEFGERFGLSQSDIDKVETWLQSQGFTVTGVANSRNEIFFQGTVEQINAAFHTEIHNYLVDGELHWANATEPLVPAALGGAVLGLQHLHNFHPRPRARFHSVESHFTSALSGDHFLSPADFATIYNVKALYSAGITGTGQTIAIVGQTTVNATDLSNFRSAAGLTAKAATMTLVPNTGTGTRCSGDEGESDLDIEWSGGVAQNASIIFVYAGLLTGETCTNRTYSVWDSLQYAIDNKIAPIISTSYGFCESGLGQTFANQVEGWVKQGNSQGQTVIAATGDSGAADCDPNSTDPKDASATGGFAVDVPAAIPEVTGAGGTEFTGDGTTGADAPYWAGATGSTDNISSALEYIPEEGWNDTTAELANQGSISASGGGASIYFAKPSWQTGTGVPADGKRDVPDIALNASPNHDGYLFCSEDGQNNTIVSTCSSGFRDSSQNLSVVGGTSAAAPTFAGILALVNQNLGNTPPAGLGNANPKLYALAASNPAAFNDVTSGNNIVPCKQGTTSCPTTAPFQYGFTAGTGYDQVTGLGSVNAFNLAQAWAGSSSSGSTQSFKLSPSVQTISITQGATGTTSISMTPVNGFNAALTYTCTDPISESTCSISPATATTQNPVTLSVTTTAATARLNSPANRSSRIFYAALLPGLLGIFFVGGSKPASRSARMLTLTVLLGASTLWLGACGNNSTSKNPGTPAGTYTVKVNATTGGTNPVTASTTVQLQVNP